MSSFEQLLRNYAQMLSRKIAELEHTYPARGGELKVCREELKRVEQAKQEVSDEVQR